MTVEKVAEKMGKKKAPLTLRTMIGLGLAIVLIFAMQPRVASSLVTVPTTIASSGSINYNPSPSGLPLSALGDDYLIFLGDNADPNIWADYLSAFTEFHCNTARLGFSFADEPAGCSMYSQTKMNIVLNYLDSVGVKAILDDSPSSGSYWYGSQAWVNDWVSMAAIYKNDARVKAFQPMNEPYPDVLDSSYITGYDSLVSRMAYLIDQIRAVDPTRTIIFPITVGVISDNWNDWSGFYSSLQSHGVLSKGNIIFDVLHPYYFENEYDGGMTPTEKAASYRDLFLLPAINYFGASNIWCGETFGFGTLTYSLQKEFDVAMINIMVSYGVGFQLWCYFTFVYFNGYTLETDILTSSEY